MLDVAGSDIVIEGECLECNQRVADVEKQAEATAGLRATTCRRQSHLRHRRDVTSSSSTMIVIVFLLLLHTAALLQGTLTSCPVLQLGWRWCSIHNFRDSHILSALIFVIDLIPVYKLFGSK